MRYQIFKRPQAGRDIEECFVFIAADDLDKGVYFLVAVEDSLEQIALSAKKEDSGTKDLKTCGCAASDNDYFFQPKPDLEKSIQNYQILTDIITEIKKENGGHYRTRNFFIQSISS